MPLPGDCQTGFRGHQYGIMRYFRVVLASALSPCWWLRQGLRRLAGDELLQAVQVVGGALGVGGGVQMARVPLFSTSSHEAT